MTTFGKNPNDYPSLGGGSSSGLADLPGAGRGGGKARTPFLRNFQPQMGVPFWAVFHYGEWENIFIDREKNETRVIRPFLRIFRHYHAGKRTFLNCSGGPDYHNPELASQLCSGCEDYFRNREWIDDPVTGRGHYENKGPVGRSEDFGLSMSVLETFFEVAGKNVNPATNIPYGEWVLRGDPRLPDFRTPQGKEALQKLKQKHGMAFLFSLSRARLAMFFGGAGVDSGASIDEKLRRYCVVCKAEDTVMPTPDGDVCAACESKASRAHLFNTAVRLEAIVAGAPAKPGQRPPYAYTLKDWRPLAEMKDERLPNKELRFDPALFETADLLEKMAPATAQQQAKVFGKPPAMASHGSTQVVMPPPEDLSDDMPF